MEPMTAQQAAEAAKGLTFEVVWAALMETNAQIAESQKRIEESRKETDAQIAESQKQITESRKETEAQIAKSQKRIEQSHKKTEKLVADVTRNLGYS
jgi:predicted  nucleic acid-binding Zn-ribbon protein